MCNRIAQGVRAPPVRSPGDALAAAASLQKLHPGEEDRQRLEGTSLPE